MAQGDKGFTILEVILFLAVSSALLLVVLTGVNSLAKRQKFTDTVDSLQSHIQRQYDEVISGVNTRTTGTISGCPGYDTTPGTEETCLLLGKLLTYQTNGTHDTVLTSSYIISQALLPEGYETATDAVKLQQVQPAISTLGATQYEVKWGAIIGSMSKATNPVTATRQTISRIAFIRIPDSSRVVTLFYDGAPDSETNRLRLALSSDANIINPPTGTAAGGVRMPSAVVCVRNVNDFGTSAAFAAVEFTQGNGAGTITTNYSPETHLCS